MKKSKKGNFRKDLYYRLNVLPIKLPPLRQRKADIPILGQFFMESISKKLNKKTVNINEETMKSLLEYEWPGNVRELENIIERMVNTESIPDSFMKADSSADEKADVNLNKLEQPTTCEVSENSLNLEFMEKNHILKVLNLYNGNITLCSKALGIARTTLYRRMEKYEIKCFETGQRCDSLHIITKSSVS